MNELLNSLLSLIAGFLIAIFTEPIRKRLDRTNIKITFDNNNDILTTPDDEFGFGKYVKVRLENTGREKYARNLRCYLTSIEKFDSTRMIWETLFDTPLPMIWAYKIGVESIDLPPKMWAYFNVVSFNKGENRVLPATHTKPFLWITDLADKNTYRFNIYVTGENIVRPIIGSIELVWRGKWDDFSVQNFVSK